MYSTIFSSLPNVAGVYSSEQTYGALPGNLSAFTTCYMVVSSASGPFFTPTQVVSYEDFNNQFGASPSEASIKVLFKMYPQAVLFVTRAAIFSRSLVEVDDSTAGSYTLSIVSGSDSPVTVTITVESGDTEAEIASAMLAAVQNSAAADRVTASAGPSTTSIYIRSDDPTRTVTVSVTAGEMTATAATPTSPTAADYIYAMDRAYTDKRRNKRLGWLIAPQAFQLLTSSLDRASVGSTMRNIAEQKRWMAVVDVAEASNTVSELTADTALYTTPRGHLMVDGPYLKNHEDVVTPASPYRVGVALKSAAQRGFQQPPAGYGFPLDGAKALTINSSDPFDSFTEAQLDVLNTANFNSIVYEEDFGFTFQGDFTKSTDPLFKPVHIRIIMNVLEDTLEKTFRTFPFTSIGGRDELLNAIENTAYQVCFSLYSAGALYGNTPSEAFYVECSRRNNPPTQLENGDVALTVAVAPTPRLRRLLIVSYRVALSQVEEAASNILSIAA